jgi:3-oxoacyl-(acyl-carrier-protein) synthase
MRRAVVTGLGFITSIGNSRDEVARSVREMRTGIEIFPELQRPGVSVKLAGTVKGFTFPELRSDEWTFPAGYEIPREQIRSMAPHGVYAFCAMQQAIADACLTSPIRAPAPCARRVVRPGCSMNISTR